MVSAVGRYRETGESRAGAPSPTVSKGVTMTTAQQHSGLSGVDVPAARPAEAFAAAQAEERADFEEDRRRQRVLDDGELGGEA
jgi:hypothetical protein